MNFGLLNIVLTGFIILMCLVLTYFLLFTELMADGLTGNRRLILVLILMAYALFRGYRLYKMMKKKES